MMGHSYMYVYKHHLRIYIAISRYFEVRYIYKVVYMCKVTYETTYDIT